MTVGYSKKVRMVGECRHCKKTMALHPRRLCWRCYQDLTIRTRYAGISAFRGAGLLGRSGNGMTVDGYENPPLPADPTNAVPGSKDKKRIMAERVARGEAIFHPLDRRDHSNEVQSR